MVRGRVSRGGTLPGKVMASRSVRQKVEKSPKELRMEERSEGHASRRASSSIFH